MFKLASTPFGYEPLHMIDAFAIALTHVLLLVAFWRLRSRDDLDDEIAPGLNQAPPGYGWRGRD